MSSPEVSRRAFIQTTVAATVGLGVTGSAHLHAQGANDRIVLAVIGTNGRGAQHAKMFSRMPGVEVGLHLRRPHRSPLRDDRALRCGP